MEPCSCIDLSVCHVSRGRANKRMRRSCQRLDFSTRFILLHAAMRLNDFVEAKYFANLDVQGARRNLLEQILKRHPHEVFRFANIRYQANRGGYRLHGSAILEGPFVPNDPGHAHDCRRLGLAA
jgi:hypothetical protein